MADECDRLRALPNELFDRVVAHLDLGSIKNLRLTSPIHAAKCLGPAFLIYYRDQETDLTPASLRRLRDITDHPVLQPAIKRLTVVAVFYDPSCLIAKIRRMHDSLKRNSSLFVAVSHSTELLDKIGQLYNIMNRRNEQRGEFSDDLAASLSTILGTLGSVDVLELTTRVLRPELDKMVPVENGRGVNWNVLWADCVRLLKLVTSAMSASKVEVTTLSIFDECFGKVQSEAFLELDTSLTNADFRQHAGVHIKRLTIGFSTATDIARRSDVMFCTDGSMRHLPAVKIRSSNPQAKAKSNFPGVGQCLQHTPNLESLDLRFYNTLDGCPWPYNAVFDHISKTVRLPDLRRLTLRGIWATPSAMLRFLRAHRELRSIDLREIHVNGGTWEPILEHLQSMPHLAELHLENLWGASEHLLNLRPTDPEYHDEEEGEAAPGSSYPTRHGVMIHTRDIGEEEIRAGLTFVKSRGSSRGKGSRMLMRWIRQRKIDYGPPEDST